VLEAATLLVATGRRPNTDRLDVTAGQLKIDMRGNWLSTARTRHRFLACGRWVTSRTTSNLSTWRMPRCELCVTT
jgi:hypothetical protein